MGYPHQLISELKDTDRSAHNPSMVEFIDAVRSKFPSAEFFQFSPTKAYIYYKEDTYAMGQLRLEWDSKLQGYNYGVSSPHIANERGDRYIKWSKDMKRAVTNAAKFLHRMNVVDALAVQLEDAARAIGRARGKVKDDVNRKTAELLSVKDSPLLLELRHLVNSGHKFLTDGFAEKVEEVFAGLAEVERRSKSYDGWAVHVKEYLGETVFDVAVVHRMDYYYSCKVDKDFTRYTADTLPPNIAEKLTLLSMVELGSALDSVGVRLNGNMFYLEG